MCFQVNRLAVVVSAVIGVGVLLFGFTAATADVPAISAQLKVNQRVGVGFNTLPKNTTDVQVTLNAPQNPSGATIVDPSDPSTEIEEKSGLTIWTLTTNHVTPATTPSSSTSHVWKGCGAFIANSLDYGTAVRFGGALLIPRTGGGPGGGGNSPWFKALVADVDIDVDATYQNTATAHWPPAGSDNENEVKKSQGMYVPKGLYDNQPPPAQQFPDTAAAYDYKILETTVRPKWDGPSRDSVGTLEFFTSGSEANPPGIQLYEPNGGAKLSWSYDSNRTSWKTSAITVSSSGISKRQYCMLTNNSFTSDVAIKAVFTWSSDISDGLTAEDTVKLLPFSMTTSPWLVTHDPTIEQLGRRQSNPLPVKQAAIMGNQVFAGTDSAGANMKCGLYYSGTYICDGRKVVSYGNNAQFVFSTTVGESSGSAKTDAQGRIYVEGVCLTNGAGDYQLGFYYDQNSPLVTRNVHIGPLLDTLSVTPNILPSSGTAATFDPFVDQFTVASHTWYGMQINYHLVGVGSNDDPVVGTQPNPNGSGTTLLGFANDPNASGNNCGDMTGSHYLQMAASLLARDGAHVVKWEGLGQIPPDADGDYEGAEKVFGQADLNGHQATVTETWGPDDAQQSRRGAAPRYVVKEGNYVARFGCQHPSDSTQVQRLQVAFTVQYNK